MSFVCLWACEQPLNNTSKMSNVFFFFKCVNALSLSLNNLKTDTNPPFLFFCDAPLDEAVM